jgi:hypothetical protein
MKIAANLPTASNRPSAREENTLTEPAAESFKSIRRNHRRKKKPKAQKIKPAKAKLPNGWYFWKPEHMKRSEFRKMAPGKCKEPRKKLRGARNKEAVRLALLKLQAELDAAFGVGRMKARLNGKKFYAAWIPGRIV